jgi:ribosomal protein S12 methylthiotransferase accessory factor
MPQPGLKPPLYASPYTGLLSRCQEVPLRAHDPAVPIWAGTLPHWGRDGRELAVGGAGWTAEAAEGACVGEAVERWQCHALPRDEGIDSAYHNWPLDEPAVPPERWVLFHRRQYESPGFPFVPLTGALRVRWLCCRQAGTGLPWWVPEEMIYLQARPGSSHQLGMGLSTGLSCCRMGDPVLLRGLQEVIERDALVGAWWGRYPLEEHDPERVFAGLPPSLPERLRRPNLRYHCFHIITPWSAHVTLVTLEGEDWEGFCFSTGSSCRETRASSWEKALLEAVQGRHFVRFLRRQGLRAEDHGMPVDFAGHALYYSLHPERLRQTVLHGPVRAEDRSEQMAIEEVGVLAERLGGERPVLFRNLTPPALSAERLGLVVLRVLVPGLQPLHGHHGFPYLGGHLWGELPVEQWQRMLPHPFA